MPNVHRIKIKLGDAEFEAEGAEDKVQAQYEQFLNALARTDTKPTSRTPDRVTDKSPKSVDDALIAQIYELRQDDVVVLRVRPPDNTDPADLVTLLLYGYRRLKNEQNILATHLLKAAQISGLGLDRIDRAAESYIPRFIMRGGVRKGTKYMLTTQGVGKAEEIAAQLLG